MTILSHHAFVRSPGDSRKSHVLITGARELCKAGGWPPFSRAAARFSRRGLYNIPWPFDFLCTA